MSGPSERDRLERFEKRRPEAVQLAELVSIAAHVEPELLREVRVTLAPALRASAEADLWFSPLVEGWSASGFSLRTGTAEILRARLRDNPRREEAFALVQRYHAHQPAVSLQEKVAWLVAMKGEAARQEIEAELGKALQTLLAYPGRAEGVSRWAAQALPRMPALARETPMARLLAFAAAHRSGARWLVTDVAAPLPQGVGSLLPREALERKVTVRIRRTREGLKFVKPDQWGHELEVPATEPALVELHWMDQGNPSYRVVTVVPGKLVTIPEQVGAIRLRMVDGRQFELRSTAPDVTRPEVRTNGAETLAQSSVRISGPDWETAGYWVTPSHVATAASALADLGGERLQLEWGSRILFGAVVASDISTDCALLEVDAGPVEGARPVSLTADEHWEREIEGLPWTSLSLRGEKHVLAHGRVGRAAIRQPEEELVLISPSNEGEPGSPVMVDGKMLGHITFGERFTGSSAGTSSFYEFCSARHVSRLLWNWSPTQLPDLPQSLRICREDEARRLAMVLREEGSVAVGGHFDSGRATVVMMALEQLRALQPSARIAWLGSRVDILEGALTSQYPAGARVVLGADGVPSHEALRAIQNDDTYRPPQLAVAGSIEEARALHGSNDFSFQVVVELEDLTWEQVQQMARQYPVALSPDDLRRLYSELRGVPGLLHEALVVMARERVAPAAVLDPANELFKRAFRSWLATLKILEGTIDLSDLMRDQPLREGDPRAAQLQSAGLLMSTQRGLELRAPILRKFIELARPGLGAARNKRKFFISYSSTDSELARWLHGSLTALGHQVELDTQNYLPGKSWDDHLTEGMRQADLAILIVSYTYLQSSWAQEEMELAMMSRRQGGHPILPVWVRQGDQPPPELPMALRELQLFEWNSDADSPALLRVIQRLTGVDVAPPIENERAARPVLAGYVKPDDLGYISRKSVEPTLLSLAQDRPGSTLILMSPRRMGKTSLLRLYAAEAEGVGKQVLTLSEPPAQEFSEVLNAIARALSRGLSGRVLDFSFRHHSELTHYLGEYLKATDTPVVLVLEGVDIPLYKPHVARDCFDMLRDWSFRRESSTEVSGWRTFSVALSVSSEWYNEAYEELDQIGTLIQIPPFDLEECLEFNQRFGVLLDSRDVERLHRLLGGHPYLMNRAYHGLLERNDLTLDRLISEADQPDGPFSSYANMLVSLIQRRPELVEAVRTVLRDGKLSDGPALRWLEVNEICRKQGERVEFQCELYRNVFARLILPA